MTKRWRKFQMTARGVVETMVSKDWVADCVDSDLPASTWGVSGAKGVYKRKNSSPYAVELKELQ